MDSSTDFFLFAIEQENELGKVFVGKNEKQKLYLKKLLYDAMYYFMDEIENPQVNNTEERWAYATAIETWYSELESR